MNPLSSKAILAIEAVLIVANGEGGAPLKAPAIAAHQGIRRRYLEQTLQALVKGGILIGKRGPGGGYTLARSPYLISVGEVVRACAAISTDVPFEHDGGSPLMRSALLPVWRRLRDEMMRRLDAMSVADLQGKPARATISEAA